MSTEGLSLDDVGDPLAVLSMFSRVVEGADDVESLTRPILRLIRDLTGLESVWLSRIDWDVPQQVIEYVEEGDEGLGVPEGLVLPFDQTMCSRSMQDGWGWNVDIDEQWGDMAVVRTSGVRSYVARPVVVDPSEPPFGSLCAASRRRLESDPRVVDVLTICSRLIAAALGQRRRNEAVRDRAEAAERRLADRIRFAAQVEHGLRTPVAILAGWAETLQQHHLDEAQRADAIDRIALTARRMAQQVQDLLDESRVVASAAPPEPVDVAAMARELATATPGHPYEVRGELTLTTARSAVQLMLEHLVENAVAHTASGTPIRVVVSREGDTGVVMVEDDGAGLPEREDLFEPFVSGDPDRRGTGLGLHIVTEVVRHLDASLDIGSSEAGGARFVVRIADASPTDD